MKAIRTKYHGPTDTRGSRISATDEDGNRVSISYDHAKNTDGNHDAAALALCAEMGWGGRLVRGWLRDCAVYTFDPAVSRRDQMPAIVAE